MRILEHLREKYQKQLLSEQEVARELGTTKKELRVLIEAGEIIAVSMGSKFMVKLTVLAQFLDCGKETSVSGQQKPVQQPSEALSSSQEEVTFWVDVEEGDDDVFTGSVTYTRGRYISQITIAKLPDGRRKRENKSFKSRDEAEAHLKERLAELNNKKPTTGEVTVKKENKDKAMTVKEFVNYYLGLGVGNGTSRTQHGYREDMKVIVDMIGAIKLEEITEDHIRKVFNQFSLDYRQVVINKRWITCKRIFNYAYKKKYITTNILEDLKKPKSKKFSIDKEKYKAFKNEEVERIIKAAKNHNTLYTILTVLKSTGMRPGELRALLWRNFNKKEKTIRIISAVTKEYEQGKDIKEKANYREVIGKTKSEYSVRTMILSDEAMDALIEWRKYLDRSKNKAMANSEYIFPRKDGGFTKESAVRSLLARFIKNYDLKDTGLNQYKFRHTMCTKLVLAGEPIPVIQRIMGDNTTDVIMNIYTHVNRNDVRKTSERLFEEENRKYKESKHSMAS